jgi:hypothetical protein
LAELGKTTPTGLSLTTFTGTAQASSAATPAAGGAASGATTPPTTGTTTPSAAVGAVPAGSVGSISVQVGGIFPGVAHFSPVAQWIDNITAGTMFDPPGVSAVTNAQSGSGTAVNFQSTLSLTSGATLAKNGKY